MHLRLVKGAYWDYEIKHAQVFGYEDYPVYSKKSLTDISFLLCAKEILKNEKIYAKFATHNAHTISSVHQLGQGKDYEFQRLYGMGELLYQSAEKVLNLEKKPSVYAPIGSYKDLLPYLVRRLLENGANSSFINRLLDPETDANWLAENPAIRIEKEKIDIPLPKNIFTERKNSLGFDLSENSNLENLEKSISTHKKNKINAESIYVNRDEKEKVGQKVYSIANNEEIGTAIFDDPTNVKSALENLSLIHI